MIVYLTIGENPSGIYSSQVIDTCRLLSTQSKQSVKLISIVSIRGFLKSRNKIKNQYNNAIVLPMFPKLENWKFNIILLFIVLLFKRRTTLICRNSFGTVLGLKLKSIGIVKKVIYDGRGCEYEQAVEYNVVTNKKLINDILLNEKRSSNETDFQLAVSQTLVNYWKNKFGYNKNTYLVIPCTLNTNFERQSKNDISRQTMGYSDDDIILVYSGSVSGWQSFDLLFTFLDGQIKTNNRIKVLLLTQMIPIIENFVSKYPSHVKVIWSKEELVNSYLSIADYGILIREKSMTNWVASPIKFGEYLHAGLKVIVNEDSIEQVINFVAVHNCGLIYKKNNFLDLHLVDTNTKNQIKKLAHFYYSKNSDHVLESYKKLMDVC